MYNQFIVLYNSIQKGSFTWLMSVRLWRSLDTYFPVRHEYHVLTGFGAPYGYSAAAATPAYGTYPFLPVLPSSSQGLGSKSAPTYSPFSSPIGLSNPHRESRRETTPWTMELNHNLLVLNCGWSKTCCTWPECDFARLVCLLDAWPVSPDSGRLPKRQRSATVYSTQLHHSKQPLGMMAWEERSR